METADSRCHSCEDRGRCCQDSSRLISRLNLCLVIGAFIYVAVLHREVVVLRTELVRCSGGAGGTPSRHTGNGHDVVVRVEETDEMEEEEVFYGHGYGLPRQEKETPVDIVTLDPQRDRPRRAANGQEGRKKSQKKRHRKRGEWSGQWSGAP
ncbi:hypothetical protein NP493_1417g00037 [Ridgeia piscesae]|uniref:Uncharacterized protein n=1 Tax=Ridgeia piscesae TaxID=27915 RepID=A0AAD9K3V2_RIDPI|nr:hypothetical protein NP493_1417g00037 [Ridgeia piscesae]